MPWYTIPLPFVVETHLMRMLILAIVTGGTLAVGPFLAAQVSDDAIEAALAAGRAQTLTGSVEVGAPTTTGRFSVRVAGPVGRVALAAALARRHGDDFGRDQITPEMLGPTLQVVAYPNDPAFGETRRTVTPAAERLELRVQAGRLRRETITPVRSEPFPLRWSSVLGVVVEGQGIRADFDAAAIPDRDFEVVVHTARGEQRYRVRPRDLEQVH
jgi:hypothetical protein